ncbi:30S ribosomal protein S9 [Candidatus Micrarchaeota archaeon]|nr:30S ribosomal protein S9 [Candidatus Micrarchaeota archaeon]
MVADDEKKTKKKSAKPKEEHPKEHKGEAPAKAEEKKTEAVSVPSAEKVAAAPAQQGEATTQKAKRKGKSKKDKKSSAIVARGKRKLSVARATVKPGKGIVRVNRMNVSALNNQYVRAIIVEPLRYLGPEANSVNIHVTVTGGGMLGQAQAARTAIANALSGYFEDMNLKDKFVSIDRSLIVEDTRRVESKKYRGPKARARFQKSYR